MASYAGKDLTVSVEGGRSSIFFCLYLHLPALAAAVLFVGRQPAVAEPWTMGTCPLILECATEYNGPSSGDDWIARVALAEDGNIIVGGHHRNISTKWLIRKYDEDLNLIWSNEIPNTYEMYGIATDPNGNIVASGTYSGDWCVIKFNAAGEQQWYKTFGTGGSDYGGAIVADSQYVYVVGAMNTVMTIKVLNTDYGSEKAQAQPGFTGNLWGAAISPITGELVAIGEVNRTSINQSMNGLVLVYNSNADQSWTWEYAGESGGNTFQVGFGVNVDSQGNIVACGGGDGIGWVQKLSSSGEEIWRRTFPDSHYSTPVLDFQDNIALVGNTYTVQDLLIRQYDKEGTPQCEEIRDMYGHADTYRGGVLTRKGELVGGANIVTGTQRDWYVAKYRTSWIPAPPNLPEIPGVPGVPEFRVFPNPFNPDKASRHTVKFQVPAQAGILIYTCRGLKVWEGETGSAGTIEWNGRNGDGKRVSPGTYIWVAECEGRQRRGTLIVE